MLNPAAMLMLQHKLHNAIYGLKLDLRAWFQHLSTFLIQFGFVQSRADDSMFTFHNGPVILIFLLYVDDIFLLATL